MTRTPGIRARIYRRLVWCWAWLAYRVFMVMPAALGNGLYRRTYLWILPWVGMYAYSESYADFCRCPMFNNGERA